MPPGIVSILTIRPAFVSVLTTIRSRGTPFASFLHREGRVITSSYWAFRRIFRWMMDQVERFPVPIEEVSCVQAFGHPDAVKAASATPAPRAVKFRSF